MKTEHSKLAVEQLDRRLSALKPLANFTVPEHGWIRIIRLALKMSLRQLAMKMNITRQSVKEMELREADGSISIRTLREIANALNMKLVYAFIPNDESLEKMIERRTEQVARTIVLRTSKSMELEDQEISKERLEKAILSKAEEIKRTMPRYLWD